MNDLLHFFLVESGRPTELSPEMAIMGLTIGLVLALTAYLVTNLSPGGMITPGWLAITVVEAPVKIAMIVVVVALSFGGMILLQKVVILYGKRLFAATVMLAVFIHLTLFIAIGSLYPMLFTRQTLGFIIPGLIAYQLIRQPIFATVLSTAAVSAITSALIFTGLVLGIDPVFA